MVTASSLCSARMKATDTGWTRYGSPDLRRCPLCAFHEKRNALRMSSVETPGLTSDILFRNSSTAASGVDAGSDLMTFSMIGL